MFYVAFPIAVGVITIVYYVMMNKKNVNVTPNENTIPLTESYEKIVETVKKVDVTLFPITPFLFILAIINPSILTSPFVLFTAIYLFCFLCYSKVFKYVVPFSILYNIAYLIIIMLPYYFPDVYKDISNSVLSQLGMDVAIYSTARSKCQMIFTFVALYFQCEYIYEPDNSFRLPLSIVPAAADVLCIFICVCWILSTPGIIIACMCIFLLFCTTIRYRLCFMLLLMYIIIY